MYVNNRLKKKQKTKKNYIIKNYEKKYKTKNKEKKVQKENKKVQKRKYKETLKKLKQCTGALQHFRSFSHLSCA